MRVPLAEVGRHGRLDLVFGVRNGHTVIRDAYCEVPFKITRILNARDGKMGHLILMQCTAGLFGGDDVACSIHVESGARVLITQQSASRIHPSPRGAAVQRNRIRVDAGGELQLFLEPVIPFADSLLMQSTSMEVERGGRLTFWESLMAGRVGRGESWAFKEVSSETRLQSEGRLLYLERFRLLPETGSHALPWALGSAAYMATGIHFGDGASQFAGELHESLAGAGIDTPAGNVAIARITAGNGPEFHRCRDAFVRITEAAAGQLVTHCCHE